MLLGSPEDVVVWKIEESRLIDLFVVFKVTLTRAREERCHTGSLSTLVVVPWDFCPKSVAEGERER